MLYIVILLRGYQIRHLYSVNLHLIKTEGKQTKKKNKA